MGADTMPEDIGHLRGVRVTKADPGRVLPAVAVVLIVVLAAAAVALTVSAADQNARISKLQHDGVPVVATVSGCLGVSSGIGMAIEYWECRGTYSLAGHQYNEVIRGSRAHLNPGQTVRAVAVPGDATSLSTPAAAARKHSTWSSYVTPIILGGVALILGLVLVAWFRRRRRRRLSPEK